MFGQGRVVMGRQLIPQRLMLVGADLPRPRATGTRLGREGVCRRQLHIPFDGGHADGKALSYQPRMEFLLDDGMDNSFAEIKGISFHHESLSGHPIIVQDALVFQVIWHVDDDDLGVPPERQLEAERRLIV
jgi:hypothetical protein